MHKKMYRIFIFPLLTVLLSFTIPQSLLPETMKVITTKTTGSVEIKEILSIGIEEALTEAEEPYQFASTHALDMDKEGNIYIMDFRENCLKKFDCSGKFLKRILRQGQGPSEISNPVGFCVNPFSGTIYVLQFYGFEMREFDLDGKYVTRYILPEQFFDHFDFLAKDKLLYISKDDPQKDEYDCLKVLNLSTRKIEHQFAQTTLNSTLNHEKRFALIKDVVWSSSDNQMELTAYDFNSGKKIKSKRMPGEIKENFIQIVKEGEDFKSIQAILYNFIQPFAIGDDLFVLLTRREYKNAQEKGKSYPEKIVQTLYHVIDDNLFVVDNFKGFGGMNFFTVRGNKILLSADEPFPHIKIYELNLKK